MKCKDICKPIGVLQLNNFGGLAITEIVYGINDYVRVCDCYGDGYKNIRKHIIKHNAKGEPYFTRNKKRFYLNEFMKV